MLKRFSQTSSNNVLLVLKKTYAIPLRDPLEEIAEVIVRSTRNVFMSFYINKSFLAE